MKMGRIALLVLIFSSCCFASIKISEKAEHELQQALEDIIADNNEDVKLVGVEKDEKGKLIIEYSEKPKVEEKDKDIAEEFMEQAHVQGLKTYSFHFPTEQQNLPQDPLVFDPRKDGLHICPQDAQPPPGLARRYICHVLPDSLGRRRRRPHPECAFAQVGVRGVEALRNALDMAETAMGLEVDDFDIAYFGHNLMHQSILYGDRDGKYDFSSGYYCGQQSDMIGLSYYGWVCQDPFNLLNAYKPITNETIALDNWIPFQYNLVGRKFNCDLLWESEQLVAPRYDSCVHPDTAYSYRTVWHNCHSYVDEVVAKYDELAAARNIQDPI